MCLWNPIATTYDLSLVIKEHPPAHCLSIEIEVPTQSVEVFSRAISDLGLEASGCPICVRALLHRQDAFSIDIASNQVKPGWMLMPEYLQALIAKICDQVESRHDKRVSFRTVGRPIAPTISRHAHIFLVRSCWVMEVPTFESHS